MATSPAKPQPFQNLPLSFKWGKPQNLSTNHHLHCHSDHHPPSEPDTLPAADDEPPPDTAAEKPCNLRPRRCAMIGAVKEEVTVSKSMGLRRMGEDQCVEKKRGEKEGGVVTVTVPKSMRLRRIGEDQCVEKKRKVRLWISLSKEEIEEDVFGMTGSRPSRRLKKRSKIVQKQLDNLLPGLCLVGVSADEYRS